MEKLKDYIVKNIDERISSETSIENKLDLFILKCKLQSKADAE